MVAVLVVDELGVLFVGVPVVRTGGMLQLGNRVGCPHVVFTAHAPGVLTAGVQHVAKNGVVAEGRAVHAQRFFGNFEHAHAFNLAGGAREELGNGLAAQANHLEQLRAAVTHIS